jgi:phosphatidate cytidylyltransferase
MYSKFLFLYAVLALIGAMATWLEANKKSYAEKKASWGKYYTYIIINLIMAHCLLIIQNINDTYIFNSTDYFLILITQAPIIILGIICIVELLKFFKVNSFKIKMLISTNILVIGLALILIYIQNFNINIALFLFVISFDAFSQIGGKLFGGPKLAPSISPNKTWSGLLIGSIVGLISFYQLQITKTENHNTINQNIILYSTLVLGALFGDLLSSYIKRLSKVKDFNNRLKYHGGFMDRLDGFWGTYAFCFILYLITNRII